MLHLNFGPNAELTKNQVFFGTPHKGSDLAWWGKMATKIGKWAFLSPSKQLLKDLERNSRPLRDVSEDFVSIVKRYKIVSYYESDKLGLGKVVCLDTSIPLLLLTI